MAKADKLVGGKKQSVAKVAWSVSAGAITISGTATDIREAGLAAAAAERSIDEATEMAESLIEAETGGPIVEGGRSRA